MNPRTLSPRKILESISNGERKPRYIGKHSFETLNQMILSLFNEFEPQTMMHAEIRDWLTKIIGVYDAINKDIEMPHILLGSIYEQLLPYVQSIDSNKDRTLVGAICEMTQRGLNDLEWEGEKPKEISKDDAIKSNQDDDDDDGLMHQS